MPETLDFFLRSSISSRVVALVRQHRLCRSPEVPIRRNKKINSSGVQYVPDAHLLMAPEMRADRLHRTQT